MGIMDFYLIKVCISITIIFLLYRLLFCRSTFFKLNRFYLLAGIIISFSIPWLNSPIKVKTSDDGLTLHTVTPGFFQDHGQALFSELSASKSINFDLMLKIVYFSVFALLLLRSLISIYKIILMSRRFPFKKTGKSRIIRMDQVLPFSFFNIIFLPRQAHPIVLKHEKAHVVQFHWVDLLLTEAAFLILWFNPIMLLYRNAVKEQHEYLADDFVLNNGYKTETYLQCILQSISNKRPIGPISQFNSNSLKKRILMMTKNKSSRKTKLFYLFSIPVFCLLFFAFANKTASNENPSINKDITVIIDPAHGGSDAGSISVSGLAEKEVTLSIAKLVLANGKQRGLRIILTRSLDENVSLSDRIALAKNSNADLFLSLHLAYDKNSGRSGAELYISEENRRFKESQKLGSILLESWKSFNQPVASDIKNSSALVLKNNSAPAVLLELGYLSNEHDKTFLEKKANQELVATKIVDSIVKYIN
jgi:N-acetylmuramoyl-L-alanine amidase